MRDAREEGSMLRRKTEDPFLRLRGKSCQHQTIDDNGQQGCRPGHISMAYNNEQQGGRQGHINITDVEDAFLIDTMDVVSQRGLKRTADSIEQYGPVEHSPRPLCLTSEEFRLDTQTDGIYSRQDIPAASETLRNSSPHPSTQVFPSFSTTATEMTGSCQFEATSSDSASSVSNDSLLNGYPELQGNSILFSEGTESLCSAQKKHRQNRLSRPPLLPPCRVCGDRASGYHYGVNTCEACKGFFRRSICKKGTYVCSGSGGCTTLTGKRTACSYCRFKRCIEVGMSKNAIKTGRYTHELRSKNTMEVKRLQNQNSGDSPRHVSVESPSNHINYTEYQKDLLNKSIVEQTVQSLISGQKMLHEFLDDYYSVDMMQERQLNVYQSFLVKKRIQDLELLIKTKRNTAHAENTNCNIEAGFVNDVPTNDATEPQEDESVVSSSYCERNTLHGTSDSCTNDHTKSTPNGQVANSYYTFSGNEQNNGTAKSVDRDVVRAEVMTTTINDMEQAVQGMLAFAKSVPGFDYLPIEDQASLLKASRLDIWYIGHIRCFNVELRVGACEWQFHADELAQIWGDAVVDHAFTMSRAAQTLDLTKEETACLRAVCLTFPDRCGLLHSREEVEHIHIQMLDVFKLVSCKRHSDYNKWFIKIINFLVLLREFGAKFELMSKQLKLDWSILKDNPLLLSVFLS